MKKKATTPLITYSPAVEARREKYAQIGAAIRDMLGAQYMGTGSFSLDIAPPEVLLDEHDPHILWDAVWKHLNALFEDISTNHSDEFWTTLYVELRLHYDQQMRDVLVPRRKGARKGGAR